MSTDKMTEEGKCCVCGKDLDYDNEVWICDNCGEGHHPECAGYSEEGYGEYPHDYEIAICKNCQYEDEWLSFVLTETKPKTKVYGVYSKCSHDKLGEIKWYPSWRHYCFFPTVEIETVHSDRCLASISEFITNLNNKHKELKAKK